MKMQQPVILAFVYKGNTVVEKSFWTPYAFVMDSIVLRIRFSSTSAVYFSAAAFPHLRTCRKCTVLYVLPFSYYMGADLAI